MLQFLVVVQMVKQVSHVALRHRRNIHAVFEYKLLFPNISCPKYKNNVNNE